MNGKYERIEQPEAQSHIINLPDSLLAALNLAGPVGSTLSSFIQSYMTRKRFQRIEETLRIMENRLEKADLEDIRDYLCSDEYIQLFLTVIRQVQIEHSEEKRRIYGLMLGNMALQETVSYDVKALFVSILEEIQLLHVEILRYLNLLHHKESDDDKWASFKDIKTQIPILRDESAYLLVAGLEKLAGHGMILSKGKNRDRLMTAVNPVGLWFHSMYGITDLGRQFVAFLKQGA